MSARAYGRGFSLIELMIAMALGLFLVAGMFQVYTSLQQSYRLQHSAARVQEDGRYAMTAMGHHLRMAGFLGCGSFRDLQVSNKVKLQGNQPDPEYNLTADRAVRTATPAGAVPGTDAFTVRYLSGRALEVVDVEPSQGNQGANVKVAGNALGLQQNDVVMITDCQQADIFRISNTPNQNPEPAHLVTLTHGGNINTSPHLTGTYDAGARVMKMTRVTYYVGQTGRTLDDGAALQALFRIDGDRPPVEEAEGVDDLRVIYGVDDDGDGNVDRYVDAGEVTAWNRVLGVRVSLLMHTIDDNVSPAPQTVLFDNTVLTAQDRRIRRVFTSTAALRNLRG